MTRKTTRLLSLALALPLLLLGASAPAQAQPDDAIVVDRVVAVVNEEVILLSELMMRVAPLAYELNKISDTAERSRRQAKLKSQVLEEMVNESLVSQAADTAKLEVSAKEVQAAISDLKRQNNLDDDQLAEALKMQGYSMASYRKDVKNQILRMRAVNSLVRKRVTISDDDVRAKYDERARRSSDISEVKLQHILVAVPPGAGDDALKAARDKAGTILGRVKAGEEFGKLAGEFSDDPATKNTGGDLGWIERGTIDSEWEDIVFSMSKGETRGPINGPNGVHLFHVSEVKDSKPEPFETAKEKLKNELYRVELDRQTRLWVEELRQKAHLELKL